MKPLDEMSAWEILDLEPGADADAIRGAYDKLASGLAPGSLALYSVADPEEQIALQKRLRAAMLELLDGLAREVAGGSEASPVASSPTAPPGAVARAEPPPASDRAAEDRAEFTGDLLRRTRESRGVSLDTLSHRTRIRRPLLEAVEAERFDALPERVFVRGFVLAIARELALNAERVWAEYGTRWEAWAAGRKG